MADTIRGARGGQYQRERWPQPDTEAEREREGCRESVEYHTMMCANIPPNIFIKRRARTKLHYPVRLRRLCCTLFSERLTIRVGTKVHTALKLCLSLRYAESASKCTRSANRSRQTRRRPRSRRRRLLRRLVVVVGRPVSVGRLALALPPCVLVAQHDLSCESSAVG